MKRLILLTQLFLLFTTHLLAQSVGIGNTATKPNASAVLDVSSNSKGVLIPRMATSARETIANPATGLLVFDSTEKALYMYDGHHWLGFAGLTDAQRPATNFIYGPDKQDTTLAGYSVSMWDQFAAIGVPYKRIGASYTGGVYIYKLIAGQWQYFTTLTPTADNDGAAFGCSVCLRGNFLIVGANGHKNPAKQQVGAAYIYAFNGTAWNKTQVLFGTIPLNSYGSEVAINQFGNVAAVSEVEATANGLTSAGIVNIYDKPGASFVFQTFIQDPFPIQGERFGYAIAMSPSGNNIVVGAPSKQINGFSNNGFAGTFKRTGSTWSQTHNFTPPAKTDLRIGKVVAASDNHAIFNHGNKIEIQDYEGNGIPIETNDEVNGLSIDPATETAYAFVGKSLYYITGASLQPIKTFGFDATSAQPHLLSVYNKNYVLGNPLYSDLTKEYLGAYVLATLK